MHEHNNNSNDNNGHKGMMFICCLVPVVLLLGGTTFFKSIGYGWLGVVLIGGFIVFHLVRNLFKKRDNPKTETHEKDVRDSTNHKSCCH